VLEFQIKNELFNSPVVEISDNEGYRYFEGISKFGKRVGPVKSLGDGLFHEVAHVAEIQDNSRLLQNNFGLHIKTQIVVLGQIFYEPTTWNATKLEARVILWQNELCKHFGIPFDPFKFATSLKYMADCSRVPPMGFKYVENLGYFNVDTGEKLNYNSIDELRHQTIVEYMKDELSSGKYTYNNFLDKWTDVIKFLEEAKTQILC
jgi:hypothetical protein